MSSNIVKLTAHNCASKNRSPSQISFNRQEISQIMNVYGQMVSNGDWKDYAMDFLKDKAVFSIYRKASEHPLYRIEKVPALRHKQGQFSVYKKPALFNSCYTKCAGRVNFSAKYSLFAAKKAQQNLEHIDKGKKK